MHYRSSFFKFCYLWGLTPPPQEEDTDRHLIELRFIQVQLQAYFIGFIFGSFCFTTGLIFGIQSAASIISDLTGGIQFIEPRQ